MSLTKVHSRMIDGSPTSVRDFGAVGDGVADDTTAIQNAINASDAVFLPEGTYKVTGTLTSSSSNIYGCKAIIDHQPTADNTDCVVLSGDDLFVTDLTVQNNGSTASDFYTGYAIKLTGDRCLATNCYVKSVFNSNRSVTIGAGSQDSMMVYNAIGVAGGLGCLISNCKVNDGVYTGLRFYDALHSKFSECFVTNSYRGFMFSGDESTELTLLSTIDNCTFRNVTEMGGKVEYLCTDNTLRNSFFYNCLGLGGDGHASGEGSILRVQADRFVFENNFIDCDNTISNTATEFFRFGATAGTDYGSDGVFKNNIIPKMTTTDGSNVDYALTINNADRVIVTGNKFTNIDANAIVILSANEYVIFSDNIIAEHDGTRGVYLATCDRATISNNVFQDCGAYGIYSSPDTLGDVTGCIITNNHTHSASTAGIYVQKSERSVISSNIDTGSTLGIDASGSDYCVVTGNIAGTYNTASMTNSVTDNNVTG